MLTTSSHPRLSDLEDIKSDSLLALIALANADPRENKIDVGVGVYKDGSGATPILRAVKAAEKLLWERIIRDEDVRPAIAVVVFYRNAESLARMLPETAESGHIRERAASAFRPQDNREAVATTKPGVAASAAHPGTTVRLI